MASSQGMDASVNALQSAYDSIHVQLSPSHAQRLRVDIARNLKSLGGYRVASLVLGYQATREEFDVRQLLVEALADGKQVALPVLNKSVYEYVLIEGEAALDASPATLAATGKPIDGFDLTHSVCLVPGLVFDAEGYRVGYAAGFLDNFLVDYPGLKVGVARGFNISSNPLPHDDHDVPVDVLVSESAVWACRR